MRLFIIILILTSLLPGATQAQQHFLVTFKDKGPEAHNLLKHPEKVLSLRSLQRRQNAGIPFTETDLPVSPHYVQLLKNNGVKVLQQSKWQNFVLVSTGKDEASLKAISPAIASVKPYETKNAKTGKGGDNTHTVKTKAAMPINYGAATDQILQLNLDCLHDMGYTGQGVLVAQFDSGWDGVDNLNAYDPIRADNRFLATRNFVNPGQTVYGTHNHGTITFSVMAANLPGTFVGGAPQATYALALTEDVSQEVHQEEVNWAAAAEWADSLGADIITSSLGYKEFDPGQGDYSSADLIGDLAIVTRAADRAASLGIIVVTSAGNSGLNGISAPCDGDSVLCVGAIDIFGDRAGFSSVGPTGDGRIKPDVVALGVNTQSILTDGSIAGVNGTSLSCPMIAGLVTCLRQAHPSVSNVAIYNALKQSADRRNLPGVEYGWGLPDACRADSILRGLNSSSYNLQQKPSFGLKTNVASGNLTLIKNNPIAKAADIGIYAITGQLMQNISWSSDAQDQIEIDIHELASGLYLLAIQPEKGNPQVFKLVKQ